MEYWGTAFPSCSCGREAQFGRRTKKNWTKAAHHAYAHTSAFCRYIQDAAESRPIHLRFVAVFFGNRLEFQSKIFTDIFSYPTRTLTDLLAYN